MRHRHIIPVCFAIANAVRDAATAYPRELVNFGALTLGSTVFGSNVGVKNIQGYSSGDVLIMVDLSPGTTYPDALYSQLTICDNCGTCVSNKKNAVITGFTGSGDQGPGSKDKGQGTSNQAI